jgi:hypothetical protein
VSDLPGSKPPQQDFYVLAASRYLPYVLQHPDVLLRAQALLLLTIYALHIPSRDHILALSSRAIRFCVENQLHLADAEPRPTDNSALIQTQLRRRVFWCAYAVDRVVCVSHDLPASIADHHITVPVSPFCETPADRDGTHAMSA